MPYDVAIIGGASAGLTAGIYAARKKLKTIILTKDVGGQSLLTEMIENFPGFEKISGQKLIKNMRLQNEKYGVEIKEGEEVERIVKQGEGFEVRLRNLEVGLRTRAIILATGRKPRHLNIPGEKEFEGKGVSFCTTCDAPLFGGKDVAVIGGGNSGLTAALDLTKYADKVYILEEMSKITGDGLLFERLERTNKVEFVTKAEIKEIKGNKFVKGIIYNDRELAIDGIFINIGWIPATEFVKEFVDLNDKGEIIIDSKTNKTSVRGVFAAGDATDVQYKQCVIAAGEGAKAALSVCNYLAKI